jgi:hypothetical protein
MAAEYLALDQNVSLNAPIIFEDSIPCRNGNIHHANHTGVLTLRGRTNNCFARYQAIFNGNIAIPEGGTVTPIAVAITVSGEPRPSSKAIITPAAVDEFGNVTSTAIITVPRGCCFNLSVEAVPASTDPTVTPAPVITVNNGNLTVDRIA